jgi:tetratricopeptide (TPR) repeat protein
MTLPAGKEAAPPRAFPVQGFAVIIFFVLIGLYSADRFLANLQRRELDVEGRRLYAAGQKLLADGQADQAVDALIRARALDRSNRTYAIALASAQMAAKQTDAARGTLTEILQQDSNYAPANLLMARIMAGEQRFKEADSYYHRAIYGLWPANQSQERLDARLEVADMLAAHGGSYELLSEALLLQNTSGNDPAILKRVAALLMKAGSPDRAAAVYQSLLRLTPKDVDAYLGLARAHMLTGDYRAAHLALVKAFVHNPNDVALRREMGLAGKLMSLDPTSRYLSSAEKLRRSSTILSLVCDDISACLATKSAPLDVRQALDDAHQMLGEKLRGIPTNEMAEARLSMAERLWANRALVCASAPDPSDPAVLLLKKINQ